MTNLKDALREPRIEEKELVEVEAEYALHAGRTQTWVATFAVASAFGTLFVAALFFQLEAVTTDSGLPDATPGVKYSGWLLVLTGAGVLGALTLGVIGVYKVDRHRGRAAELERRHARLLVVYAEQSADRRSVISYRARPVQVLSVVRAGAELAVSTRLRLGLPRGGACKCGGRI